PTRAPYEAREHERRRALGKPAQNRRSREQDHPGQEDLLAADEVAGPAGQEQQAAIGDQVRVDNPGELCRGEAQVALDRGQRDVHDRRVKDDHELAEADDDQSEPPPRVGPKGRRMNFHNASSDERTNIVTITITGSLQYLLHGLSEKWD